MQRVVSKFFFRFIRWGVFVLAILVDYWVFNFADPFTSTSFAAAGGAAVLLYFSFAYIFSHMRARGRIRRDLGKKEKVIYSTGYHIARLLWQIWTSPHGVWVKIPLYISGAVTVYYLIWLICTLDEMSGIGLLWWLKIPFDALGQWNWAIAGLYSSLLFAIPHTLYFVAEWSMHRYVVTNERLILHDGILDEHMLSLTLERVVDSELHRTFSQRVFGYGDILLHLTSGGEKGETLECVHMPKKFERIRREASRGDHASQSAHEHKEA
jgi:hypothetical protein